MSKELLGNYKLVLGLEIHLHLKTDRKMFCRCDANIFHEEPNTHTCPVCLGLPGALPVPNPEAIRTTQILGLALNSQINKESRFDRKHYFYPDLPKGYQISQYEQPLCLGGYLELSNGTKANLERVHLEEDTAKSSHVGDKTLIDFNMSSIPLVEIVTKPTFDKVTDAVEFAKKVQDLVRELSLGDVDMEKGQMRLEPNISLRTPQMAQNDELPDYKVEIKNINSFRFMERAVEAEIKRQRELLESGGKPVQENRGYIEEEKKTVSQRTKEQAHDYRYFPEPDIPPLVFDENYLQKVEQEYQELLSQTPSARKQKILAKIDLKEELKKRLISELDLKNNQTIVELTDEGFKAEELANLYLNRPEVREMSSKEVAKKLAEDKDKLEDEEQLTEVVKKVVSKNEDAVESYKRGKENALQFLMGMVMRETKGKAEAEKARELLLEQLKS